MLKKILVFFLLAASCQAQTYTMTIDSSSKTSSACEMSSKMYPAGLIVPAGITDSLKVEVSQDNGTTYYPLTDTGAVYYILVDNSQATAISLDERLFKAWRYFRVVAMDTVTTGSYDLTVHPLRKD